MLLTNGVGLLAPWILKYAVDGLRAGMSREKLLFFAGLTLGVAVVQGFFRFLMRNTLIGVSRLIESRLRLDIFDHLQKLPLEFFQANRTGDLISRATSDLENVRLFLGPGIMNMLNTAVLFTGAVAFMLTLSPRLMLISLIPLPLAVFLMTRVGKLFHTRYRQVQEANALMSTHAQENFSGIRVVKTHVQEERQIASYRARNEGYLARNLQLARLMGVFHPMIGFIMGLTTIIILWAGGRMIIRGELTIGGLVAFLGFMSMLIWPTIALGWVINLFQRGSASMVRINWILETVPSIRDLEEAAADASRRGAISFRGLAFTYPGTDAPVLRGIDLEIAPGQTVALVGRTGAGKSTLAALIPRLFEAPPGTLFIDGVEARLLPLALLRGMVGFAPQETFLFSDTLERNIGLGMPENGRDARWAARAAGLEADVDDFPQGFDTLVGERGITLSGGQKQRAALARALIRDPRILILDDVFSSVDAETEKQVLANLRGITTRRTTIVITHRLTSITRADLIAVMENGRIVERGRHEELMAENGIYASMFRRQSLMEEMELEEDAP